MNWWIFNGKKQVISWTSNLFTHSLPLFSSWLPLPSSIVDIVQPNFSLSVAALTSKCLLSIAIVIMIREVFTYSQRSKVTSRVPLCLIKFSCRGYLNISHCPIWNISCHHLIYVLYFVSFLSLFFHEMNWTKFEDQPPQSGLNTDLITDISIKCFKVHRTTTTTARPQQ